MSSNENMSAASKSLEDQVKVLGAENAALRDALGLAGLGIWSWDLEDVITLDARASRLLGMLSLGAAPVADVLVQFEEQGQVRLLDTFDRAWRQGETFDELFPLAEKGQIRIQGQLSGDRQKLFGTLSLTAEVACEDTEDRRVEDPVAQFRMEKFLSLSSDLYLEQDYNGHIQWLNSRCEAVSGFTAEMLVGRAFLEFVHPEDIASTRQYMERVVAGEVLEGAARLENRCRCRNGDYLWLSWVCGRDADREIIYAIGQEISTEKVHQARLAETLAKVQDSNAELQSFASVASHDLREPLRMISSYLRLLQERSPELLDARAQRYINYACEGADRMRTLIEDLLSYSRLGSADRVFEPVALDDVLEAAIGNLSMAIQGAGAEVTVDIDNSPVVSGDRNRLVRLFQNLLANSIKFHHEGVTPRVSVRFADGGSVGEPNQWVVAIEDNGIGIDPDHQDLLFNAFQRLNTRDEFEGSGIGLAICKKIAEQHDGRIWFASEVGKGSTFYVTLAKQAESSI